MLSLSDTLDVERYNEIVRHADLLVNLWQSAKLAAERGDNPVLKLNCQQAHSVTKATFALVKTLGSTEVADG